MITRIPIIVLMIGVIIHFLGIVNILKITPPLYLDVLMFLIDSLVAYGLLQKKKWGWYCAIALFIQQSIMQPYWSYQKYISHFVILHPLEFFMAPILVAMSLIILIKHKNLYIKG